MPGKQTSQAYDLLLIDPDEPDRPIGLMLARDPRRVTTLEGVLEPSELGQASQPKPVPVIWNAWNNGAGVVRPVRGVRDGYGMARNACTRFGSVTPAGALHEIDLDGLDIGLITGFVPFTNDNVYMLTQTNRIFSIRGGTGPVELAHTFSPDGTCDSATIMRGEIWFAFGTAGIAKFDGTTWSQADTSTGLRFPRIKTVTWTRGGIPRGRLVATNISGSAFVYTTGDNPLDPTHWSSEVKTWSRFPIAQLVGGARHVYGIGADGVIDLTEMGETPIITGEVWTQNYDKSNGAVGCLYDGKLALASGAGTFAIDLDGRAAGIMEDISIGHLQPAELPVGGMPRILLTVDGWLLQVTYSELTQTSQVWWGIRRDRVGAATPWPMIWHGSECDLVNQDVTAAAVVSPPNQMRRLLLGTTDKVTGEARLWWQSLPKYGSPLQDYAMGGEAPGRMDYARDWDVTHTAEDLGDPASLKDPLWWEVLAQHLGGPNRLTLDVAPRAGGFVQQGVATTDDIRLGGSGVRDKSLTLRVTGANSESVPAVLEAVKGSWVVTVEESTSVILPVIYGQGVKLLNQSEDTQDADFTFALLRKLTEHASIQVIAWNGEQLRARVEQGIRRRWQEDPGGQGWLDGAILQLTVLSRPMRHDVGHLHDLEYRHDG